MWFNMCLPSARFRVLDSVDGIQEGHIMPGGMLPSNHSRQFLAKTHVYLQEAFIAFYINVENVHPAFATM